MIDFINKKGGNPYENDEDYKHCLAYSKSILKGDDLPYTELTYIQSTGTQWIETGISGASDVKIILSAQMVSSYSNYNTIFGCKSSNNIRYQVALNNETSPYFYFNNMSTNKAGNLSKPIWGRNFELTFDINGLNMKFTDGENLIINMDSTYKQPFNNNTSIPLWRRNGSGWSSEPQASIMKIYYCKIYKNNVLVRDFIPVKHINGTICLYEKLSNTYYYNAGTGNFLSGEEV